MTEQTTSQVASVAPEVGRQKRSIQMRFFADKDAVKRATVASIDMEKAPAADKEIPVGQVVGVIYDVRERTGKLPNGEESISLLAIGDFEAVAYGSGEVANASAAYLPRYFLETAKSMIDKTGGELEFAIEVLICATGKSIPYAYEVKNLIKRRPDSAIDRMKAELAKASRLRLPPPSPAPEPIEGEVREIGAPVAASSEQPEAPDEAPGEVEVIGDGEPSPRAKAK